MGWNVIVMISVKLTYVNPVAQDDAYLTNISSDTQMLKESCITTDEQFTL